MTYVQYLIRYEYSSNRVSTSTSRESYYSSSNNFHFVFQIFNFNEIIYQLQSIDLADHNLSERALSSSLAPLRAPRAHIDPSEHEMY